MFRSLLSSALLFGASHCLTCSTSATINGGVSNAVNSTGLPQNATTINLASVSCPATLDRCMLFTATNLSDVLTFNGVQLQSNLSTPLMIYRNGTINGLMCASQADCSKKMATNATSCLNSSASCCCTGDMCTTKGGMGSFTLGSALVVIMMVLSH